jgi:hypothetical protein
MSAPAFPLTALRVPSEWKHAAERGRIALYLSSWLTLPTAVWLVLNLILFPGHLLARRHGRAYAFGASLLSAGALCAWTFAAASPVLEREYLPFFLRLLWAYCVAVLPLAIMSAADEKAFVPFVAAAQVQLGVLALAAAQAADLPVWAKLSALILLAAASTWAVDGSWLKAHPTKR